ncbi:MAG: hypothetical protein EON59_04075, partial [Alphaproteobacteria bacterium]
MTAPVCGDGWRAVHGLGLGQSNEWYTPASVFDALGCRFDLDVAAPTDGPLHVPTSRWISRDSLSLDWTGFVWMNPPFGGRNGLAPWLDKFFAHGNGIALTPDRTSAPWFQDAWKRADMVMFTRKTPFLLPNGTKAGSPAFGTTLWAVGEQGVAALRRAHSVGFGQLALPNPPASTLPDAAPDAGSPHSGASGVR